MIGAFRCGVLVNSGFGAEPYKDGTPADAADILAMVINEIGRGIAIPHPDWEASHHARAFFRLYGNPSYLRHSYSIEAAKEDMTAECSLLPWLLATINCPNLAEVKIADGPKKKHTEAVQ